MRLLTVILLCCVALLCACSRPSSQTPPETARTTPISMPAAKPTPAQIVRASADALTIKAGGAADASVRLTVADGYHINANPATFSYLKATELEVVPPAGLSAGKPVYPAPVLKKFQFAPQPLAVYEH